MPKALITGVTGQDGSYLAEFLLAKGYEVHGIIRRTSSFSTARIEHIYADPHEPDERLRLHYGDLNDASSLQRVLATVEPDEVYNLGAQSHVRVSFEVAGVHRRGHARSARSGCSRRCATSACRRGSIRRRRARCTARSSRRRRRSARRSTRGRRTRARRCSRITPTVNYRESYGLHAVVRHPVQPREPAPRRDVRHAQDHARPNADQAGAAGQAVPRQPRRASATGASPATTSRRCG